jgi:hypothetical protein
MKMNMSQSDTDQIVRGIYFDADTGFGGINETNRDAKKILSSITYSDV